MLFSEEKAKRWSEVIQFWLFVVKLENLSKCDIAVSKFSTDLNYYKKKRDFSQKNHKFAVPVRFDEEKVEIAQNSSNFDI